MQGADPDLWMVRDDNGHRGSTGALLHGDVATLTAGFDKTILLKNLADIAPGEDAKFTQQRPPVL